MCRFLLLHIPVDFDPTDVFLSFAAICSKKRGEDGEGQRDGWGMAWLQDDSWQVTRSLRPIWEDVDLLLSTPRARTYALHARSASFEKHRNHIEYNQPYVSDTTAFVFNGILRGVHLPQHVAGNIGAQRIWNLLQQTLKSGQPQGHTATALATTLDLLSAHSQEIAACNIGLIDRDAIYAASRYTRDPDYYQLRYHSSAGLRMVCSEPLAGYDFADVPLDRVIQL